MMGETLLNPHLLEICKYIKKRYALSSIVILSNGSIPPRDMELVKYIDILGFSIDGGTKEIFESLRQPLKFETVKENIEKWMIARNQYNPNLIFRTSTTVSTLNMQDLPNIVEMIGKIEEKVGGGWDSIYCQPVIIEEYQEKSLRKNVLNRFDIETGSRALQKTRENAEKYHIRLDMPLVFDELFGNMALNQENELLYDLVEIQDFLYPKQVLCEKLECGILSYDLEGNVAFACCFMDKKYYRELIERYQIPDHKTAVKIYNSRGYWNMRKDLLNGKLMKECRECLYGKSDYYRIKNELANKRS